MSILLYHSCEIYSQLFLMTFRQCEALFVQNMTEVRTNHTFLSKMLHSFIQQFVYAFHSFSNFCFAEFQNSKLLLSSHLNCRTINFFLIKYFWQQRRSDISSDQITAFFLKALSTFMNFHCIVESAEILIGMRSQWVKIHLLQNGVKLLQLLCFYCGL